MGTKARVLVACGIGGLSLTPNQVVDLPAELAKVHVKQGEIDTSKAAVDYCINELGAEVIVYKVPATAEQIQLQAEIESLEAILAEAEDADKPVIQSLIDEKKKLLG